MDCLTRFALNTRKSKRYRVTNDTTAERGSGDKRG